MSSTWVPSWPADSLTHIQPPREQDCKETNTWMMPTHKNFVPLPESRRRFALCYFLTLLSRAVQQNPGLATAPLRARRRHRHRGSQRPPNSSEKTRQWAFPTGVNTISAALYRATRKRRRDGTPRSRPTFNSRSLHNHACANTSKGGFGNVSPTGLPCQYGALFSHPLWLWGK